MERVLEKPMHHEIGIATNWRREVEVIGRPQAEVANVDDVVLRLLERAEEEEVQRALHPRRHVARLQRDHEVTDPLGVPPVGRLEGGADDDST